MFSDSDVIYEVSIRMLDGEILRGSIAKGHNSGLESILAKESQFVEFIAKDGQRKFLSKSQIAWLEPVEPLQKPTLAARNSPNSSMAHTILGITETATLEEARTAYHQKAKQYHPDNYSSIKLPKEVATYVNNMFMQVNAAYAEIQAERGQKAA